MLKPSLGARPLLRRSPVGILNPHFATESSIFRRSQIHRPESAGDLSVLVALHVHAPLRRDSSPARAESKIMGMLARTASGRKRRLLLQPHQCRFAMTFTLATIAGHDKYKAVLGCSVGGAHSPCCFVHSKIGIRSTSWIACMFSARTKNLRPFVLISSDLLSASFDVSIPQASRSLRYLARRCSLLAFQISVKTANWKLSAQLSPAREPPSQDLHLAAVDDLVAFEPRILLPAAQDRGTDVLAT